MTAPLVAVRAAQYLRMSTERQDYSLAFQTEAIGRYARDAGYSIVRTFSDEGVSGLGIEKRAGLQELLSTVISGRADFEVVLVYDVSRWGRFQNPDQAAHYEFMCVDAGVSIRYCAESFGHDVGPMSNLMKHVKRAMAAEYSRELSAKVRHAHAGLKQAGFWMGSTPGFGLRRQAVSNDGRALGILQDGQRNSYDFAHTRLVPGPPDETDTVRRLFALYLEDDATLLGVASALNREGRPGLHGRPWTLSRVSQLLLDVRYAGDLPLRRSTLDLGVKRTLPKGEHGIVRGAIEPVVDRGVFDAVQARRSRRQHRPLPSRDEALADVATLGSQYGVLTRTVLRRHGRFSLYGYKSVLGGLDEIRRLQGQVHRPNGWRLGLSRARAALTRRGPLYSDDELLARLADLWRRAGFLSAVLIDGDARTPRAKTYHTRFGSLTEAYRRIEYRPVSRKQAAKMGCNRRGKRQDGGSGAL